MKIDSFEEIWEKLNGAKSVVMSLHPTPDGDCLGACAAMKYVLEKEGKEVKLISPDELAENLRKFKFFEEIEFGKNVGDLDLSEFDVFLMIDISSSSYLSGKLEEDFDLSKVFVINIDHHNTNKGFGNLNYLDINAPSACSILMEFFKKIKIEFDEELATRLLLGLCTDTGFFTFDHVAKRALREGTFLVEHGADYVKILESVLYNQPLKLKQHYALHLNGMKIYNGRFGLSSVSYDEIKKLGLNRSEVRLSINDLQMIGDLDFVCTLDELDDHIKGSFRSKRGIDVSKFASRLGGGGHKQAAAFRLEKMPLNEAEKKVLEAVDRILVGKIDNFV